MSARSVAIGGLGALVIAVAGCSGALPGGAAPVAPDSPAANSSDPSSSDPGPSAASPSAAGPTEAAAAPDGRNPVATAQVRVPLAGDPEATIEVELLGLERQGKLLVMSALVTPTNALAEPLSLYRMTGDQSWAPQLIDPDNLKLYRVVQAAGSLQSNQFNPSVASGSPLFVQATFAAPPPEVSAINVQFIDQMPSFEDVPIR